MSPRDEDALTVWLVQAFVVVLGVVAGCAVGTFYFALVERLLE